MNAPTTVSGEGSVPSVSAGSETSRTRTLRNEGASADSISSTWRSSSSGRTPTTRTSRTRSGSARLARLATSAGWLPTRGRVELGSAGTWSGPRPGPRSVTIRLPSTSLRARRAGPCPRGPGRGRPPRAPRRRRTRPRPPGPAATSASDRARGSRAGRPAISSVVMTTSSRSVLPGMAIEPWTMPIRQVAPAVIGRRVESGERAGRRALGVEDRAVDDRVEGGEVDLATASGVRTVTRSSRSVLPAIALRS